MSDCHLTQQHLTDPQTTKTKTKHIHFTTPSQHDVITLQWHHNTTPSCHNTIMSQHNHNKQKTSPQHYAILTKQKQKHSKFCDTTTPQHNTTAIKSYFLSHFIFILYSTPPSILHHMTWVWRLQLGAAIWSLFFIESHPLCIIVGPYDTRYSTPLLYPTPWTPSSLN